MDHFEPRLCAQTYYVYSIKTFYVSQMNPKKFLNNTSSQFNYHTLPVTPFNLNINIGCYTCISGTDGKLYAPGEPKHSTHRDEQFQQLHGSFCKLDR